MKYSENTHNRHSTRLKGYDYTKEGAYFVTICTHNKQYAFGNIVSVGASRWLALNRYGEIAKDEWLRTAIIRKNIHLDEFIIMPNHVHGIIFITERMDALVDCPTVSWTIRAYSIGSIIGQYKSVVTKAIRMAGCSEFSWQRNYYEHIIRNEKDLEMIREYILTNPLQWESDRYNNLQSSTSL